MICVYLIRIMFALPQPSVDLPPISLHENSAQCYFSTPYKAIIPAANTLCRLHLAAAALAISLSDLYPSATLMHHSGAAGQVNILCTTYSFKHCWLPEDMAPGQKTIIDRHYLRQP